MKKRLLMAAAATAAILCSYAQINAPTAEGYLARAEAMLSDQNYYGCIDQLINAESEHLTYDQKERVHYYRAIATVHTDPRQAIGLLQHYIAQYPQSMRLADARLALGNCYYGSDYSQAHAIYSEIDPKTLSGDNRDELLYRSGYCNLMLGDYKDAAKQFGQLTESKAYRNAAIFYQGYIAYADKRYAEAERQLKEVNTSTAPGNMADYYLSQIYFMRDDYTQALSMAKNLLKSKDIAPEFIAEANRIAGESAYQEGQDTEAINYLERYVSMTQAPLPSALYILGINSYNEGYYDEAIERLNPVTAHDNAMAQSAYLYLGQAYLHQGDPSAAAMAFNRALNMDYDADVRETAYYNYAVASANGGKAPFASTVKIFSDFLSLYPESLYAPDVQDYIITSYLTDGNYTAALESINQMAAPTEGSLKAKQRILYVLGNKALATSNYDQALIYLQEADALAKHDRALAPEVSLALGEALYRQGEYAKAAAEIQKYIKAQPNGQNVALAHYDLGYALYAQKRYSDAAKEFGKFLSSSTTQPATVVADAYNRLGDCNYFDKDFAAAQDAYDKAYHNNPTAGDYALYQKALMAGYQRQHRQKIDVLTMMRSTYPTSALIPDALLETTESYIQLGDNAKAIETYRILVDQYPNTAQGRQGYLQMALTKLNSGNRQGAIADYKEVIRRYPTSEEAAQAVEQMKRIAAADGTLPDLVAFLKTVESSPKVEATEIEQLTFESAEKEYLTERKTEKLEAFVNDYPESNMRSRALSYLMESMLAQGDQGRAYDYAMTIVEQYPASGYAQQALAVKARHEEAQGKGNLALRTWQKLAQTASSADVLNQARMGVIRNGREGKQYDDVLEAADAVIASSGVGADDMAEAIYTRGWVLDNKGDIAGAREEWSKIADQTDMLYGIMSAQSIGESLLKEKDYAKAESWAKKVANADSPHTYWIARGFILLSDVYSAQGDNFKARQYLEAVRDNYDGTETDIYQMIDQRLK